VTDSRTPPAAREAGAAGGATRPGEAAAGSSTGRTASDGARRPEESPSLSWPQRRFLLTLGLPSLALALALTIVTTYLPVFIAELTGPALTGVVIGSEGLLALFVPLLVGARSDRARTRFGRRRPFLIVAAPVAALALVLLPLTSSIAVLVVLLMAFFAAYFAYYSPYRALYPDLVPEEQRGRSQGFQGTLREIGLGGALVGGGLLLGVWQPLPFVVAAAVLLVVTAVFIHRVREPEDAASASASSSGNLLDSVRLLGRADNGMGWLVVGTGMWEFALGALRTFVVLFLTVGLGLSTGFSSLVLAVVAGSVVAASIVGGKLADRLGHGRMIHVALWVYGLGILVPFFVQSPAALAAVPVAGFAAGIVMTLPFGMLMALMPESGHGAASGLFELSRGVGVLLGPALTGLAIHFLAPALDSTQGYAAMFPVAAAAILLSIPVFRRAERSAAAAR
jgi:Na+/melibiose symporter-like transporter